MKNTEEKETLEKEEDEPNMEEDNENELDKALEEEKDSD